jgi:uncharacterized protein (DUF3084 family)
MHLYSVIFILALLAFGGIAAYLGDILGYRLGKRRFSLLHLRPRTTARLVGILAGILIPAVTVLVGYWQVDYVRMALVELDDLRRDLDGLRDERDTMREERNRLRDELTEAQRAANSAQAEAEESRNEFEGVKADLGEAKEHLDEAQARVSGLRVESGRLRADKERVQSDLGKARESLGKAGIALDKAEDSLRTVERQKDDAERERERLKGEVAKLKDQYRDLEVSIEEELEDAHSVFARRLPIFDIGTELVRGVVARPADLDSLKNKIVALLVLADQAAEAAGAARGENDRYVWAILPRPTDTPLEEDGPPPESRVLGSVVRQLWEAEEQSHVVRVIAARRSFSGEQVYVGFAAEPNRLVFREGETIVSRRIEAGVEEADAFEQLWLLIADPARSEVRKQAQAAGLLPDPKTGRYGEVQVRELFRAAQECARRTGPRAVRVDAAQDTYTAGPLSIEIVVEPSQGASG